MPKYLIEIGSTAFFEVEAENPEEAREKVQNRDQILFVKYGEAKNIWEIGGPEMNIYSPV